MKIIIPLPSFLTFGSCTSPLPLSLHIVLFQLLLPPRQAGNWRSHLHLFLPVIPLCTWCPGFSSLSDFGTFSSLHSSQYSQMQDFIMSRLLQLLLAWSDYPSFQFENSLPFPPSYLLPLQILSCPCPLENPSLIFHWCNMHCFLPIFPQGISISRCITTAMQTA